MITGARWFNAVKVLLQMHQLSVCFWADFKVLLLTLNPVKAWSQGPLRSSAGGGGCSCVCHYNLKLSRQQSRIGPSLVVAPKLWNSCPPPPALNYKQYLLAFWYRPVCPAFLFIFSGLVLLLILVADLYCLFWSFCCINSHCWLSWDLCHKGEGGRNIFKRTCRSGDSEFGQPDSEVLYIST